MTFTTEYYEAVDLHVRWSDTQDLVLRISPHETIADIKQKIQQSSAVIRNKYIRLIHNGRILHDNTTLSDHNIGKFRLKDAKVQQTSPLPVYIHCSVSEYVPEKRIPVKAKTSALTSSRGFDRLRDSGFSDQDIQLIRTQFHRLQGTLRTQNTRDQAQYLEEQWMEHSETALSDESE
ncbi:uncharacterized protein BYT42DRAFT_593059 [Radiomyces spectabilis]|uniref:uncharacterized protein n=1 Tax=Radiomyces spectabilis TaxID=64574 RepID=UPI00221FD669|nr:uncharacterized protein BYT42DRAFT_593059 [Radiomyces spectabilis]KAI8381012.1 hypothetical protein BYT42DRAFT_593059 [Radiomyces spectabilis]